jgi:hypothetical protein
MVSLKHFRRTTTRSEAPNKRPCLSSPHRTTACEVRPSRSCSSGRAHWRQLAKSAESRPCKNSRIGQWSFRRVCILRRIQAPRESQLVSNRSRQRGRPPRRALYSAACRGRVASRRAFRGDIGRGAGSWKRTTTTPGLELWHKWLKLPWSTKAAELGTFRRPAAEPSASRRAHSRPALDDSMSPFDGGAGWWKSPSPDLARGPEGNDRGLLYDPSLLELLSYLSRTAEGAVTSPASRRRR